ncbi:hypothetical protein AB0J86_04620 [Micromonospora sp. NPDC049559]|uniref:hypothetical protein n=1 Tax=Micromonospora sp. NPDC049559 TaxID=3155923 RepID=UPI00344267EC
MARIRRRRIRVDDVEYGWAVRRADPGRVVVTVWPLAPGGAPVEFQVDFDDPWLNYGPIITTPADRVAEVFALDPVTPRLVAELIREAVADGWRVRDGTRWGRPGPG